MQMTQSWMRVLHIVVSNAEKSVGVYDRGKLETEGKVELNVMRWNCIGGGVEEKSESDLADYLLGD